MRLEVHRRLADLSEAAGKEYGKLVQKLLAVAFLEAGAGAVTDRSTQGIDLEVELDGAALALEVKTTEGGALRFGKKDLDGLAAREAGGARAYLAVLGPGLLDEWTLARFHRGELRPSQSYSLTELRPYRDGALERRVRETFPAAVLAHAAAAARGGQRALDEVLARYPGYRPA